MRALILSCTLKPSPSTSNTELLARTVIQELEKQGVETELIRVVDRDVKPGVKSDMGPGDAWPAIRERILSSEILILATPTWVGQPSSIAQRVVERMDAMLSETDPKTGLPVAYNRVGGVVVTGNEDGAHHIVAVLSQVLIDVGFTVPAQSWTYWNMGPGPGPTYPETDHGHAWAAMTGRNAARNLLAVAKALKAQPLPKPESAG